MNYHLTAFDIMQTDVASVSGALSVHSAVTMMRHSGTRSLLVEPPSESDDYGIISYSDIVNKVLAEGKDPRQITVKSIATTPTYAVLPNDTVQTIAMLFRTHGIGHAPVINHEGLLIGIVSMTDLITEGISEPE